MIYPQAKITYINNLFDGFLGGRFAFLVVIGLVTYFWWPALWDGKLIIHGDAAHHGLSLLSYHSRVLAGDESVLWASRIYGGHPLFAEGQGGFANPLNIICAYFFEPTYGMGVFHWLSVLVGAAGIYQLCRILTISRWSATFASIAVVFSTSWIAFQHNLTVSATLAWVPWLMVAAEYWLKKPSLYRAILLAIPAALLVFAGYAQLAQGALVFLIASFLAEFLYQERRLFILMNWQAILATGVFSIILAATLSAVQLVPLFELVGQSHRSEGTEIVFAGLIQPMQYLGGLLYFNLDTAQKVVIAGSLGNIAVVLLAISLLAFRIPSRILGYIIGTALLFNLGMEYASPIFRIIYEHNLIPGLHYHRVMHLFFPIAIIGFSVLAACALDKLAGMKFSEVKLPRNKWSLIWTGAFSVSCMLIVIYICIKQYDKSYSMINLLSPIMIISITVVLSFARRGWWLAPTAVFILLLDVLVMRSHVFNFYDASINSAPLNIQSVITDPELQNYRVHDGTGSGAMVFLAANDSIVELAYRRYLKALSPFSGLGWHIPTIDGVMALPLARRVLINPILQSELAGASNDKARLRVIDILGVRYISMDSPVSIEGISLFSEDKADGVLIYKNNWAKPRFQIYNEATLVDTPQDALAGLQAAEYERLFIERTKNDEAVLSKTCITCTEKPPIISQIRS